MTTTIPSTTPEGPVTPSPARMSPMRKAALIAGVAYIATFIFSIPVKFGLWADALNTPGFILGEGSVVSAVALYTVAKRYSHRAALGFVTTRVLECAVIFMGVLSIMSMYSLRQDLAGSGDTRSLLTTGHALVAMHDWTFLIGPGLMPALNALCIGSVMYRSRLLPRWIPTLGLVGAPLLLASFTATLFGLWDQISTPAALLTLPIAVWELSFGIFMTVKGFKATSVSEASFTPVNSAIAEA